MPITYLCNVNEIDDISGIFAEEKELMTDARVSGEGRAIELDRAIELERKSNVQMQYVIANLPRLYFSFRSMWKHFLAAKNFMFLQKHGLVNDFQVDRMCFKESLLSMIEGFAPQVVNDDFD